jgi:hypothetical protein
VPLPKISQDVGGVAAAKPAKEPAKETPKKK